MTIIKHQTAKQRAGGGCGHPAIVSIVPPLSIMTAQSFTLAALSIVVVAVFAPLCGLIWTLESSNPESSTAPQAQSFSPLGEMSQSDRGGNPMNNRRPQVLLLGNGVNLAYNGFSWSGLMKKIKLRDDLDPDTLTIPLPFQAILVTNDHLKTVMKEKKELFSGEIRTEEQMRFLQQLLRAGFDEILTTNYSYELEAAAEGKRSVTPYSIKKHQASTVGRAEPKYLFHTYHHADFEGVKNRVWHIHGESRKPDSMILGHYWYGSVLSRMKSLSDEGKNSYYQNQKSDLLQKYDSWLDSFIMGDVYVLGFGFDLAEIDMWWLLNRKKREKAETGKLFFYEMQSREKFEKTELMRLLGAEIINFGMEKLDRNCPDRKMIYRDFYDRALSDIKEKMEMK